MRRTRYLILVLLSASLMYGCAYPGALFVEEAQISLEVAVSTTDTRPVHINFGYDRTIFSIAPKTSANGKSASLLSKTDLLMQFTEETEIKNIFVSGEAASLITCSEEKMDALFGTGKIDASGNSPTAVSDTNCQ